MVCLRVKVLIMFTERLHQTTDQLETQCPLFNRVRYLFTYLITNPCYYVPSSIHWEQVEAHSWISWLLLST